MHVTISSFDAGASGISPLQLIPFSEALRLLGCGRTTGYHLLNEGHIKGVKLLGKTMVAAGSLQAYIEGLPRWNGEAKR